MCSSSAALPAPASGFCVNSSDLLVGTRLHPRSRARAGAPPLSCPAGARQAPVGGGPPSPSRAPARAEPFASRSGEMTSQLRRELIDHLMDAYELAPRPRPLRWLEQRWLGPAARGPVETAA